MREISLVWILCLILWDFNGIDADTYEILTIPIEQIFPERYGNKKPINHQRPGIFQPRPGYSQNNLNYQGFLNNQQSGFGGPNDWVCRHPSGNVLIISDSDIPFREEQFLRPNKPQVPVVKLSQPVQPVQPVIVPLQPSYPEQNQNPQINQAQSSNSQINQVQSPNPQNSQSQSQNPGNPFLSNPNQSFPTPINCNNYPQHPMCGETIILGTTTSSTTEKAPNTNGEGLIDIRIRGNDEEQDEIGDQLVFNE